jgi:hypothetical protein
VDLDVMQVVLFIFNDRAADLCLTIKKSLLMLCLRVDTVRQAFAQYA